MEEFGFRIKYVTSAAKKDLYDAQIRLRVGIQMHFIRLEPTTNAL